MDNDVTIRSIEDSIRFFQDLSRPFTKTDPRRAVLASHLCVSIVTSYEVIVKNSIMMFIPANNCIFSTYMRGKYEKLNAKVKKSELRGEFLASLDGDYINIFDKICEKYERIAMAKKKTSPSMSLGNMAKWRHGFVHEGKTECSIESVLEAHASAKMVIIAYSKTLKI